MNIFLKYIFNSTLYILVKCPIKFYGTLNDTCEWRNNPVFGRWRPVYATAYLRRNDLCCIIYRMYHFSFLFFHSYKILSYQKGKKLSSFYIIKIIINFVKKYVFWKISYELFDIVVRFVASTQLQMDCKILINRD